MVGFEESRRREAQLCEYLTKLWEDERGLAAVEHAMLLAFIAAVLVTAFAGVHDAVLISFQRACAHLGGTCLDLVALVKRPPVVDVP